MNMYATLPKGGKMEQIIFNVYKYYETFCQRKLKNKNFECVWQVVMCVRVCKINIIYTYLYYHHICVRNYTFLYIHQFYLIKIKYIFFSKILFSSINLCCQEMKCTYLAAAAWCVCVYMGCTMCTHFIVKCII